MNAIKKRYAVSLSSWFCIPGQGMKDFEILNRASAFIIRSKPNPTFQHEYHVVTSSHVIAPWKWPKYYPQEWLKFVNESHTFYSIEVRHPDGIFEFQSELLPITYHHATKDLAAVNLMNEDKTIDTLQTLGVQILDLAPEHFLTEYGSELEYHGHDVTGLIDAEQDARLPKPKIIKGSFSHRSLHQTFGRSIFPLMDGMCGGPVVLQQKVDGKSTPYVCGAVEGIVPVDHVDPNLRGLTVFAESKEIETFLRDIEAKRIIPLIGGDSVNTVAADKDESKMDIEEVMKKFEI